MKYTVRTKDGELVYDSFGQVEQAWLNGLVGPEDELREEGATKWRKAGSIPLLVQARRHGNQVWGGTQLLWITVSVVLGSAAMYLIAKGNMLVGGLIAVGVAVLLFRVTTEAFKKSKPHG
ncbi:MAG: hypothetical protein ACOZIN_09965 [Myxococcota bacterium]